MHQARELLLASWSGHQAHRDRNEKAQREGEDRRPEVLRHLARVLMVYAEPAALDTWDAAPGQGKGVMQGRSHRTREQADKCAMPRGALPEHAEKKGGKQGRVHEGEEQLQ